MELTSLEVFSIFIANWGRIPRRRGQEKNRWYAKIFLFPSLPRISGPFDHQLNFILPGTTSSTTNSWQVEDHKFRLPVRLVRLGWAGWVFYPEWVCVCVDQKTTLLSAPFSPWSLGIWLISTKNAWNLDCLRWIPHLLLLLLPQVSRSGQIIYHQSLKTTWTAQGRGNEKRGRVNKQTNKPRSLLARMVGKMKGKRGIPFFRRKMKKTYNMRGERERNRK